jgi:outer membrane protein TolC
VSRYRNGLVEYTTVLLQLNTMQALERDTITARLDLLRYRVDLHRALGGTWMNEMEWD